jgi:hypothetical protein
VLVELLLGCRLRTWKSASVVWEQRLRVRNCHVLKGLIKIDLRLRGHEAEGIRSIIELLIRITTQHGALWLHGACGLGRLRFRGGRRSIKHLPWVVRFWWCFRRRFLSRSIYRYPSITSGTNRRTRPRRRSGVLTPSLRYRNRRLSLSKSYEGLN